MAAGALPASKYARQPAFLEIFSCSFDAQLAKQTTKPKVQTAAKSAPFQSDGTIVKGSAVAKLPPVLQAAKQPDEPRVTNAARGI